MTTITLNIDDPQRLIADLWAAIEATGNGKVSHRLRDLQDAIHTAIPKPRISEPGPWGVVAASHHLTDEISAHWVHAGRNEHHWYAPDLDGGRWAAWDDLIDPVLIREGI